MQSWRRGWPAPPPESSRSISGERAKLGGPGERGGYPSLAVRKAIAGMETAAASQRRVTMDEITALAKRRGFVFQSSEIYGGINGFWDYGPLGAILKQNVKRAWWRDTVELRDDVVAFDSSIVMHPSVWKASGHVDAFHDVMIDCKV